MPTSIGSWGWYARNLGWRGFGETGYWRDRSWAAECVSDSRLRGNDGGGREIRRRERGDKAYGKANT